MELYKYFKSILEQDYAPIVVCDIDSIIIYMNSSAIKRYRKDLTGRNLKNCHPPKAKEKIDEVVNWFKESKENNIIYMYHEEKENKDMYMVALRDEDGTLIGYYEKQEFRNRETVESYQAKVY